MLQLYNCRPETYYSLHRASMQRLFIFVDRCFLHLQDWLCALTRKNIRRPCVMIFERTNNEYKFTSTFSTLYIGAICWRLFDCYTLSLSHCETVSTNHVRCSLNPWSQFSFSIALIFGKDAIF